MPLLTVGKTTLFDVDIACRYLFGLRFGYGQRQDPVVAFGFDAFARDVFADVIASRARFADFFSSVFAVFLPFLLVADDGQISLIQADFNLFLGVAGDFDIQFVRSVRFADIRF